MMMLCVFNVSCIGVHLNTNASNFVSHYQRSDWLVRAVLLSFRSGIR